MRCSYRACCHVVHSATEGAGAEIASDRFACAMMEAADLMERYIHLKDTACKREQRKVNGKKVYK